MRFIHATTGSFVPRFPQGLSPQFEVRSIAVIRRQTTLFPVSHRGSRPGEWNSVCFFCHSPFDRLLRSLFPHRRFPPNQLGGPLDCRHPTTDYFVPRFPQQGSRLFSLSPQRPTDEPRTPPLPLPMIPQILTFVTRISIVKIYKMFIIPPYECDIVKAEADLPETKGGDF